MVTNPQALIAKLKIQHRGLQHDLVLVSDGVASKTLQQSSVLVSGLATFKHDLLEHLTLENGEFYPDYLHKKEVKGEDLESTKEFIKKMDDIGKAVMGFLDTYATPEAIDASKLTFQHELQGIIKTLNVRIETEEEGVYDIYLVY